MAKPQRVSRTPRSTSKRNLSGGTTLASTNSVGAGKVGPSTDKRLQVLGDTVTKISDHFVKADQINELGKSRTDLFASRLNFLQSIKKDDPANWKTWEPQYEEMMQASKTEHSTALPSALAGEFQKTYSGIYETGKSAVGSFARNTQISVTLADFMQEEDVYAQAGMTAGDFLGREEAQAEFADRVDTLVTGGFISPDNGVKRVDAFNLKVTNGRMNRLVYEDLKDKPELRLERLNALYTDITTRDRAKNIHGLKEKQRTDWERAIFKEMNSLKTGINGSNKVNKELYQHNEKQLFLSYEKGIQDGSMLSDKTWDDFNAHVDQELVPGGGADTFYSGYGKWSADKLKELGDLRKASISKVQNHSRLIDGISSSIVEGDPTTLAKFFGSVPSDKRGNYVNAAYRSAVLKAIIPATDTESTDDLASFISAIVDGDTTKMNTLESKLAGKYDINNLEMKKKMLDFLDVMPGNHVPYDVVSGLEAGMATPRTMMDQAGMFRELSAGQKSALPAEMLASYEIFDTLMGKAGNPDSAYAAAINKNVDARDLDDRRKHLDNKYKEDGGTFGITEDFLDSQFNRNFFSVGQENPIEDPRNQRVFQELFLRHFDSIQDVDAALASAWRQFSSNIGDVDGTPFVSAPNIMYGDFKQHSKGYVDKWTRQDMVDSVTRETGYKGDPKDLKIMRAITNGVPGYLDASVSNPVYEVLGDNGLSFLGQDSQSFYWRPDFNRYKSTGGTGFPDYQRSLKNEDATFDYSGGA